MKRIHAPGHQIAALIILSMVLVSEARWLGKTWNTNLLSLDYLHQAHEISALSLIPSYHQRASLWNTLAYIQNGNYQNALVSLQPLIDVEDRYGLRIKGWLLEAQGDYRNAIQLYTQVNSPTDLLRICRSLWETRDLGDATIACQSAWRIDSTAATQLLASVLMEKGDLEDAEIVLRQSLGQTSHNVNRPYWLFKLAAVLETQGRWAESATFHQQGINEQRLLGIEVKDISRAYADLAIAYLESGETTDAITTIQDAIAFANSDIDSLYSWLRAGHIYESAGLLLQAVDSYQHCLELRSDHTICRKAIERLSSGGTE